MRSSLLSARELKWLGLHLMPERHAVAIRKELEQRLERQLKECEKAPRLDAVKAAASAYMNNFYRHLPGGDYRDPASGERQSRLKEIHSKIDEAIRLQGFNVSEFQAVSSSFPSPAKTFATARNLMREGLKDEEVEAKLIEMGLLPPKGTVGKSALHDFKLWPLFVEMVKKGEDPSFLKT